MNGKLNLLKLTAVFFVLLFGGCSSQPSMFDQVGYHKKALSNGANFRVFSIYVNGFKDGGDVWSQIEGYAKKQMHTQGGTTIVFFFNDRGMTPDVTMRGEQFDKKFEAACVAGYWKYPSGSEKFIRFPFK